MNSRQVSRVFLAAALISGAAAARTQTAPDAADKVRAELVAARRLPPSLDRVLTPVIDQVWAGFDRAEAMKQVEFMGQYWRLPGNAGFDASLDRVRARLAASGFADIGTRPSAPVTRPSVWVEPAPTPSRGWDHTVGTLAIVRDGQPDQIVLSREKERLALCINSFSTPPGGVTAPLVDVGVGNTPADYEGKDVKGAVVFGSGDLNRLYAQAVVNRGALGVVTPARADYLAKDPDLLNWSSIPYDETHKAFGFKATMRAYDALKQASAAGAARVHVEIASTFANKPERTLVAEIPGTSAPAERIVISAHVQEPGANDNASGVATNMELSRALAMGIAAGKIPKPARTLTFLWVNENAGTRRWLTEHPDEKAGVKYGFSMDMTGEDITRTGGHFLIERWPDPGAVWTRPWDPHTEWGASQIRADTLKGDLISDLHMAVCERVALKTPAASRWDVRSNPYEGGSDHTEFGRAGIPALLDWHFTDRYYHTNEDTADKTSPDEMRNVGTAVASTAWLMASATDAIAADVKTLITRVGSARVNIETREGEAIKTPDNATIVAAWRKWYDEAIASVDRLKPATAPKRVTAPPLPFRVERASHVARECTQVDMPFIKPTPRNVLWAVDARFFCNCDLHPPAHKEMREADVVRHSGPASKDAATRLAAAHALGELSGMPTDRSLRTLLLDTAPDVRAEAANAIAQTAGKDPTGEWLAVVRTAALAENNDETAGYMFDALGRMAGADASTAEWLASQTSILQRLPRITGALKGLEAWTRAHRTEHLSAQAVDTIRKTLTIHEPDAVRTHRLALQVLLNAGDRDRSTILAAASDNDWQTRRLAVMLLGSLPEISGAAPQTGEQSDARVPAMFGERLKDVDFHVRIEAVKAAARGAARSGDCAPLERALDDREPAVVIQALDSLPAPCVGRPDDTPDVADAHARVLARVTAQAAAIEDPLRLVIWPVSAHALATLAKVAPKSAAPLADKREFFAHTEWQVRAAVAALAGATGNHARLRALASPEERPNVRTAALAAMAAAGSPELVPSAVAALDSTEPQLVREAARHLKTAPPTDEITAALFASLKRLSDQAKDTSRDARLALFDALTNQKPVESIALVQRYLEDYDPEIANAAQALCARLVPGADYHAVPRRRLPAQPSLDDVQVLPQHATLVMKDGDRIEMSLLVNEAPMSIARFAQLARLGYYNGLTFHRWVSNFVLQGGSPDANEYSGDARFMRDELGRQSHVRGAVGISTRGRDTGDAQIFIDLVDVPRLDHDYTVFALVEPDSLAALDKLLEGAVIATVTIG